VPLKLTEPTGDNEWRPWGGTLWPLIDRGEVVPPYPCYKCGHARDEHEDRVGDTKCSCEGFED
jgi:hypothetical protein